MSEIDKPLLIVVCGATASGKTALAIDIARRWNAEIISCDARQFYREMSIGTAKPTDEELAAVPHHFINNLSIHDEYTVGDYETEATDFLDKYFQSHRVGVLVGGSGLFLRAVCEGIDKFPDIEPAVREALEMNFQAHGIAYLQTELQRLDPVAYAQIDICNHRRLLRALEVCIQTQKPFSSFQKHTAKERSFTCIKIGIHWERSTLYDRINQRVDMMLEQGLVDEAKALYAWRECTALRTVGYQEIFDYMNGQHSLATAIDLIKQHSRNYAKRQDTWFRREKEVHWFDLPLQRDEIFEFIESKLIEN